MKLKLINGLKFLGMAVLVFALIYYLGYGCMGWWK